LLQRGLRLVKILLRLFGIDPRDDLDLLHLQFGFAQGVFRLLDLGFVFRSSCILFCTLLQNLVDQFAMLGLLVDVITDLRLAVELHQ
jgi:hypothetical protein